MVGAELITETTTNTSRPMSGSSERTTADSGLQAALSWRVRDECSETNDSNLRQWIHEPHHMPRQTAAYRCAHQPSVRTYVRSREIVANSCLFL
jgi:hypothetical protein